MSRENRMLILFVIGVVLLFTYLRSRYPNLGETAPPPAKASIIKVLADAQLSSRVKKVAKAYELEFSIRVIIETFEGKPSEVADFDLIIATAELDFSQGQKIVHRFYSSKTGDQKQALQAALRSVNDARRMSAARFARYLFAADRGRIILFPKSNQANP